MIRLIRICGFLLMGVGILVTAAWFIKPLRQVWDVLLKGILQLPWQIRVGLGAAAIGLLLLVASLIWERFEDRESDRGLLNDEP